MGEHERLARRIGQIRATADAADQPGESSGVDSEQDRLRVLEARLAQLEQLVQGLQDSVHRETSRQAKRIAELETRIRPGALGKALSDDARARGL